jgi:hypothetical protein
MKKYITIRNSHFVLCIFFHEENCNDKKKNEKFPRKAIMKRKKNISEMDSNLTFFIQTG